MDNMPNDAVGLYRTGITSPEQLTSVTVAREHLLDDVIQQLNAGLDGGSLQHRLYIGPRGIGKTHFLSLICNSVLTHEALNQHYIVVRLPEESNRILSYADFLLAVAEYIPPEPKEQGDYWQTLFESLELEEKDQVIIDSLEAAIREWCKAQNKTLLVMIENFDTLLSEQIKTKEAHSLRRFLMGNPHVLMIATAPFFVNEVTNVNHPLYDFFDIQTIDELTEQETITLIEKRLEWDKRNDLLEKPSAYRVKVRSLYALTGGNSRLIMMLYNLITQDEVVEIKTQFLKLLDHITPFYQDRIKDLPAQERALLETIALMRSQQRTPTTIAKQFRKNRAQTSSLLKRLVESGYLVSTPNPNDKRSRLYRIKEGFFDIWLAMNESRVQRKHLPFLLDFFATWYTDKEERELKRTALNSQLANPEKLENTLENHSYLLEISEDSQETKSALAETILKAEQSCGKKDVARITEKLLPHAPEQSKGIFQWMTTGSNGEVKDSYDFFEQLIGYWQTQRTGDLEKASMLFETMREEVETHGWHELHLALLEERVSEAETEADKSYFLNELGLLQKQFGLVDQALDTYRQALNIDQKIGNKAGEGTTLNNISQIYDARGDFDTALSYLKQSLAIQQKIGDKAGICATLFNMGHIAWQNDQQQALSAWINVYHIAKPMQLSQVLAALENLGNHFSENTGLAFWEMVAQDLPLVPLEDFLPKDETI